MPEHSTKIAVTGVPPKKDGANSMWRKAPEMDRLKRLRVAAAAALREGPAPPGASVQLDLRLFAPASAGDLDNFVTGICDGLQAAHPGVLHHIDAADWQDVPNHAHPARVVAFVNDSAVDRIVAARLPDAGDSRYELVISW